ncbi:MAG: TonB-dependent receptor [Sphingobium sp.]
MALRLNRRSSRALFALGATTILTPLALPGTAWAQAADTQLASAADVTSTSSSDALGDIVVTATRSAESVQRVPISIQALSPEKLEQRQVASFADYANLVPSLSFSTLGPGRSEPFFRGISVEGGALPTVGVYLDDIPLTTAGRMPDVHVYDIERIEALSGPQGTLFGASSLAGTLRIITNKPNPDKFEAGYDVQVNKYGKGDSGTMLEGFMNLPVMDGVAVRLMGFYRYDGGYIDNTPGSITYALGDDETVIDSYTINNNKIVKNDYNPVREYGGRAAIGIDLNDSWTVQAGVTGQYLDAKGSFNFDPDVGDLKVHDYNETYLKDEWYQGALTVQGKIGDFDIVSATGYFTRKIKNANDYTYYTVTYDNLGPGYESYLKFRDANGNYIDPTQQYLGRLKQTKLTQEVRLSVPKSWPFSLTVGGFYQRQKNKSDTDYYIPGLGAVSLLPSNIAAGTSKAVKRDAFYLVETDTTYTDIAFFGEGTYEILPTVKLTGGIRYFDTKNTVYGFGGVDASARSLTRAYDTVNNRRGCAALLPLSESSRLTCINTDTKFAETGETHKVSASWQITPSKMVYATYSTGFRPGGQSRISPRPYLSDTLTNYEIGFKTTWGGKFRLNGAIYLEKWNGIQYTVVPPGNQGAGVTVNAGNAEVKGVEVDFDLRLGGLTLSGSGAYNDAALSSDFCALDPGGSLAQLTSCPTAAEKNAVVGTRLPRQPRFKGNASARYVMPIGEYEAFVQGVVFYQTNSTSDLDTSNNALLGNTPAFATVDFSAGIKRDNWNFSLFLQNAFDKRGELSRNTFCSIEYCSDSSRTYPIKPQFFGMKFGQRF